MTELLTAQDFADAGLSAWHVQDDRATAELACGSFSRAGELAHRVAQTCDGLDHHADLDIRYPDILRVTTWSHDAGGLTDRDLRLARAVQELHAQLV